MARILIDFRDEVAGPDGRAFKARAVGRPIDHVWEGWLEFVPLAGGPAVRTERETTQPNFADISYWATGLTPVYLEGALARALQPSRNLEPAPPAEEPVFSAPRHAVLDPFSVFAKGEELLRRELAALSRRHLVTIAEDFDLEPDDARLEGLTHVALEELIVERVRERVRRRAA